MNEPTTTLEGDQSHGEGSKSGADSVQFENLLDDYGYQQPKRGEILEGEIAAIDDDAIILDVGLKRAAIVPTREAKNLDDQFIENLSVGDTIPIHVLRTPVGDQSLLVSIDKARKVQSWEQAKSLLEDEDAVELKITGKNRGGLLVQFDQLEGFVPNSHLPAIRSVQNPSKRSALKEDLLGTSLLVKPIEVKRKNRKLVFSALAAEAERRERRLHELEEGSVVKGKVVNVLDFGVFVDLGDVDGLVHVSELDWSRVKDPRTIVKPGEEIEAKILSVDIERERVELSRKQLLPSPWEMVARNYQPGDFVKVKITSVVDFGAFGELPEGVQGLIHVSELGYSAPENTQEVVEEGETVLVRILDIQTERERISLSMRRVPLEKQLDWMSKTEEKLP